MPSDLVPTSVLMVDYKTHQKDAGTEGSISVQKREHGLNQGQRWCERKTKEIRLKIIRCSMVGQQLVSSSSQTLPLSRMGRSHAEDSRGRQEMGTKDDNIKERMEMTKKNPAAIQWKPPEHRKFQNEDVGVRKAPKLMFASQRYQKIF